MSTLRDSILDVLHTMRNERPAFPPDALIEFAPAQAEPCAGAIPLPVDGQWHRGRVIHDWDGGKPTYEIEPDHIPVPDGVVLRSRRYNVQASGIRAAKP